MRNALMKSVYMPHIYIYFIGIADILKKEMSVFKTKVDTRDKEGQSLRINKSIHQEDITIVSMYVLKGLPRWH